MADDFILSIEAAPAQDQIKALRKNVKSLTSEFDKLKKSQIINLNLGFLNLLYEIALFYGLNKIQNARFT